VNKAAAELELELDWQGSGLEEQAVNKANGKAIVRIDPRYFRPTEVETLLGDASKARSKLGWSADITFEDLVKDMVASDLTLAQRDALMDREGFAVYRRHE
jgi:GDPmannose 4,6-dehydratase